MYISPTRHPPPSFWFSDVHFTPWTLYMAKECVILYCVQARWGIQTPTPDLTDLTNEQRKTRYRRILTRWGIQGMVR